MVQDVWEKVVKDITRLWLMVAPPVDMQVKITRDQDVAVWFEQCTGEGGVK